MIIQQTKGAGKGKGGEKVWAFPIQSLTNRINQKQLSTTCKDPYDLSFLDTGPMPIPVPPDTPE
jgi:hypothetical protein